MSPSMIVRGTGLEALENGARQSTTADALEDADSRVGLGQAAHQCRRPVGGVVIDEENFVIDAGKDP